MCYPLPGPRCSHHVKERLDKAIAEGDPALIAKYKQEYLMTPDGIDELRRQGKDDTADLLQSRRDKAISAYKEAQRGAQLSSEIVKRDDRMPSLSSRQKGNITNVTDPIVRQEYISSEMYGITEAEAYVGVISDERISQDIIQRYDFKAQYQNDYTQAQERIEHGDLDTAKRIMEPWENAKNENQCASLQSQGVAPETYQGALNAWNDEDSVEQVRLMHDISTICRDESYDQNNPNAHFIATQYFNTQDFLERERVSTVRIYTSFPDIMNDNIDVFTLDPRVARAEGGQVYSKDVPANTVVSLPGTGLGSSVTHDVTVLNVSMEEWASVRGQ